MRPGASLCQSSRYRLLTLLLVLLLGYIGAHTVNGSHPNLGNISKYSETVTAGTSVFRNYRMVSSCSERNVQMKLGTRKKAVDARGRRGSRFSILTFESRGRGQVRIFGEYSQKYLCFSRRGRLILRTNTERAKERCLFKEKAKDNYTMLQSVANEHWYVGFNKKGKRLKGYNFQRKRRKCYYFTKVLISPRARHRGSRNDFGPKPNMDLSKIIRPRLNNR